MHQSSLFIYQRVGKKINIIKIWVYSYCQIDRLKNL